MNNIEELDNIVDLNQVVKTVTEDKTKPPKLPSHNLKSKRSRKHHNRTSRYDIDISLVSEIKSELEESANLITNLDSNPKEYENDNSETQDHMSGVESISKLGSKVKTYSKVSFKPIKKPKNLKVSLLSFPCYSQCDVIKFQDTTQCNLLETCTKGDNDQDTDDDELEFGKNKIIYELDRALKDKLDNKN